MSRIQFLMDCLFFRTEADASMIQQPALSSRRLIKVFPDRNSNSHNSGCPSRNLENATAGSCDPWANLDVELAFRLGIFFLALPRPPASTGQTEVRLYDQEVTVLYRLIRLPLDTSCPWVLDAVREEARRLVSFDNDEEATSGEFDLIGIHILKICQAYSFEVELHKLIKCSKVSLAGNAFVNFTSNYHKLL